MIVEVLCQTEANRLVAEHTIDGDVVTKTRLQFTTRGPYCLVFHDAVTGAETVTRRTVVPGTVVIVEPPLAYGYITVEECCDPL